MKNTLEKGDAVPHFEVTRLDGGIARYASIWQHRDLVLLALPPGGSARAYASELAGLVDLMSRNEGHPAELVITREPIPGAPAPCALVADRWGEIFFVAAPAGLEGLPPPAELVEWLRYVQVKCPECEGESR